MLGYRPYSEYKDSDVEWLGKVPKHWHIAPVGKYYNLRNGYPFSAEQFFPNGLPPDQLIRIRDILGNDSPIYTQETCPGPCFIENGDVLIGMDGDFNTIYWSGGSAKLNQRVCAVRGASQEWDKYFLYAISTPLQIINDLTFSTTVKHLSSSQVLKIRFSFPPQPEMEAIAIFLDVKTAQIDALIEKKEALLEQLAEKRTALISHAVSKGIAPNTKMKDSGVVWLGQVPAHWDVKRLRFCVRMNPSKNEISLTNESIVSFIPMDAVGEHGGLRLDEEKELSEIGSGYTYFANNDVVVAKITPCFENGKGAIAKELTNGVAFGTTELHVMRAGEEILPEYLFHLTMSYPFRMIGESEMYGAGGQKRIPENFIKDFRIGIPPLLEQEKIIAYINEKNGLSQRQFDKAQQAINKLREYRSALITQAVTGKIDVREFKTPVVSAKGHAA